MKKVLLSADGEIRVFLVPDEVADNLEKYCTEFCSHWLNESPDAAKYRQKIGDTVVLSYTERDFIEYLNRYISDEPSVLVETLPQSKKLPKEYKRLPRFNF